MERRIWEARKLIWVGVGGRGELGRGREVLGTFGKGEGEVAREPIR